MRCVEANSTIVPRVPFSLKVFVYELRRKYVYRFVRNCCSVLVFGVRNNSEGGVRAFATTSCCAAEGSATKVRGESRKPIVARNNVCAPPINHSATDASALECRPNSFVSDSLFECWRKKKKKKRCPYLGLNPWPLGLQAAALTIALWDQHGWKLSLTEPGAITLPQTQGFTLKKKNL